MMDRLLLDIRRSNSLLAGVCIGMCDTLRPLPDDRGLLFPISRSSSSYPSIYSVIGYIGKGKYITATAMTGDDQ